ncbi:hypothetical protein O181_016607 [Austropuccinia psidii MF-1]|uniref:Uncharacterized protein n=1 Tax=Austropuccinia psidii MF-1 TaxID=1389203 RepID=A0A9Q3GRU7_9BASI|nr:hypothetical protein [Austropuccinia psidii MF-1]
MKFEMMIQMQEAKSPWEIFHMDWVTPLLSGGYRSYNACLVLVDRYSKTPMFLQCHKDDTAMDTDIMIWNKVIGHTGVFQNIISEQTQTSLHNYGQTSMNCLEQSYHLQELSTLKLIL